MKYQSNGQVFAEPAAPPQPQPKQRQHSRFDYVKYDDWATRLQKHFKDALEELEHNINGIGVNAVNRADAPEQQRTVSSLGRSKASAVTKLEELYMWIGKAIRDEQILRNGNAELFESRNNG